MPWSGQGGGGGGGPWGGGGRGPWGGGSGGPQPPDLEELLRVGQARLRSILPKGFGNGRGIALLVVAIAVIWLATGFYRVQPDEQGVELVFGKWYDTTQPGLNYNWPPPIGGVLKPQVTRVNRVEVGFRSGTEVVRSQTGARDVGSESLMLTGDENIIDIHFTVFWVIKDAGRFLFSIRRPEETVKDVAESAMREVIGRTPIASALAEGRQLVEQTTFTLIQEVLDAYDSGIQVTQVELQKVDPPAAVIDAFRDVQRARADQERLQNEAEAYRNDVLPRARGDAARLEQEAEAYKQEVLANAEGQTKRFLSVLEEYNQAKDVTRQRMYLETMEQVLRGMNKVIIDTHEGGQPVIPYLPLPELQKRSAPAAGAAR